MTRPRRPHRKHTVDPERLARIQALRQGLAEKIAAFDRRFPNARLWPNLAAEGWAKGGPPRRKET